MEYYSSDDSDMELFQMIIDCDDDSDSDTGTVQKKYRPRVNYMEKLNDYEFAYRFRINKSGVNQIINLLQPYLSGTTQRNHRITTLHQTLLTLRFFALDGTHILIQSTNSNIGEEFRNTKGTFSMNVQVVCNASLIFQNVVARWPGSTHDATIFNHSDLKDYCEQGGLGNRWLLGDSGYPYKPYLLTPLLNPNTPSEQRYNEAHIKTRNTIEIYIGVWKIRFPVLSLKSRLKLENIQAVIIATSVLHYIARSMNLEEVEPEVFIPNISLESNRLYDHGPPEYVSERQHLIDNYFQ
ncbi:unnamed protein product [Euphydryas editha]|uniref:DDE Tnp4 domain-containing protein n=1 Tax=Euphydryas editha TaxID=104508 RepID=A0AAU9TS71_EUPED|nr:unnamed protein product [Euphydryas editha]